MLFYNNISELAIYRSAVCTSHARSPVRGAKKFQVYGLGIFLSKPQAWYIIRRKSVYHQRRLSAFASHHASACIFLRLDDIQHYVLMICNSFGIDDIHALWRDFTICIFVLRVQEKSTCERRVKLAEKSQNLSPIHGRGELYSPAGVHRTPLRISKN